MRPVKIVAIGPESTGKSTLCAALARHYRCTWVPEYAREYLLAHKGAYNYEDLLHIAKGQIQSEDLATTRLLEEARLTGQSGLQKSTAGTATAFSPMPPLLFIDTDMYVMKVWCEYVFGRCHPWILEQIARRSYDLYLLCNTDLPWAQDELREYPDLETREKLFCIYKDLLINQDTPWIEIQGSEQIRHMSAIKAVDQWASQQRPL